jgi:hypothetical protein
LRGLQVQPTPEDYRTPFLCGHSRA